MSSSDRSFNTSSMLDMAFCKFFVEMHRLGRNQEAKMLGYTRDHTGNVALLCQCIGSWLEFTEYHIDHMVDEYGLDSELVALLFTPKKDKSALTSYGRDFFYLLGFLHDIGKPERSNWQRIYALARRLNDEEHASQQGHAKKSSNLIVRWSKSLQGNPAAPLTQLLADAARYHHERLDGKGYENIPGDEIPWCAQFVAVVDIFEAMTGKRPYEADVHNRQSRRTPKEAIEEIRSEAFEHHRIDSFTAKALIAAFNDPAKRKILTGILDGESVPSSDS